MLFNLLATTGSEPTGWEKYASWVIMGVLLVVIIVFMILSRRSQKKKQQEQLDQLNAIGPGNKVKTIGGICGVVVEVCPEDNTFILETGSEASGKSYIKFDKQAVYQTDAVAKKAEPAPAVVEAPAEDLPVVEAPSEEKAE